MAAGVAGAAMWNGATALPSAGDWFFLSLFPSFFFFFPSFHVFFRNEENVDPAKK